MSISVVRQRMSPARIGVLVALGVIIGFVCGLAEVPLWFMIGYIFVSGQVLSWAFRRSVVIRADPAIQ